MVACWVACWVTAGADVLVVVKAVEWAELTALYAAARLVALLEIEMVAKLGDKYAVVSLVDSMGLMEKMKAVLSVA